MPSQTEIRQQITNKIVVALEQGTRPWRMPWSCRTGRPANVVSKRSYSGINPLLLALHSMEHGFTSRWWGTYRQWQELGGNVRRRPDHVPEGQWGCRVVFYKPLSKTVADAETNEEREERFFVLRTYTVFNLDQCEGEALGKYRESTLPAVPLEPDYEPAESLIDATGAEIRKGGDRAYYALPKPEGTWPNHSDGDYVVVPFKQHFRSLSGYYETLLHELAHWSEPRLNWDRNGHGYAMGELIAEIASCYLAAAVGLPQEEPLDNHASYVQSWLDAMRADHKFIFRAATQASKVADYLLSLVGQSVPMAVG